MAAAVRLDLTQGRGLRGGDVAGANAVALNVVLAVLGSNVFGQHLQAALGSSVSGNSLTAQFAHHGADVDDLAAALLDHVGDDGLGNDKGSVQVNINDLTELCSGHFAHGNALDDTGVVDQNVDVADFLGDLLDHGVDGVLVGNIADIAMGSDASLFVSGQTFINQFLLDIIENDGSAAVCHSGGDSKTDAVRSAGDQGNLAGQIKRFRGADRHISYLLKVMLCNSKAAHRAAGERDWK